jgi:hypothetical protein
MKTSNKTVIAQLFIFKEINLSKKNLHHLHPSLKKTPVVNIYYCITTWEKPDDYFKFVFRERCLIKKKPD